MGVHNLQTAAEAKETFVNSGYKAIVVDAFSRDLKASKTIAPKFVELSNDSKFEGVLFAKLDVDQVPSLAEELGIKDLPCLLLYKNGDMVAKTSDPEPSVDAIADFVEKAL